MTDWTAEQAKSSAAMDASIAEIRQTDAQRTRQIVRKFGYSAMFVALVAIGLGSYLIHSVNKLIPDKIVERLTLAEVSNFSTGELVRYRASQFDRSGQRMLAATVDVLEATPVHKAEILKDFSYLNCRGEIIDHWADTRGQWFATVTLEAVFRSQSKGDGAWSQYAVTRPVSFVLPESSLELAINQKESFKEKKKISSASIAPKKHRVSSKDRN